LHLLWAIPSIRFVFTSGLDQSNGPAELAPLMRALLNLIGKIQDSSGKVQVFDPRYLRTELFKLGYVGE